MDKLQMAHEMACAMMASNDGYTIGGAMACAWEYADAMQKEADSRKPKGLPKALSPEVTHLNNTLAVQNMVYDDEFHPTGYETPTAEWQPDWSQAAPKWANHLAMTSAGTSYWFESTPWVSGNGWIAKGKSQLAFCDTYHKGNWKNSLRSRP